MRTDSKRLIDRWLGIPLCALFGWLLRLREAAWPRRSGPVRSVMLLELSEMGSLILALPALDALRKAHPGVELRLTMLHKNAETFGSLKLFPPDHACTLRDDGAWSMLVDVLRFAAYCRRHRVDTVIDLETFTRISALLAMLSGATRRVGFDNYLGEGLWRGRQLTHRVHYNAYQHMSQNFLALALALESPPGVLPLPKQPIAKPQGLARAPVDEAARAHVRAELARVCDRAAAQRIVVLNHDAGDDLPQRTWPAERFTEVARGLLAWRPDLLVVLIGVPRAHAGAQRIVQAVADPRCVNFVGRTRHLQDVVQLLHDCDLLITNDSGPAHLASLTDIRCISLFGPETPHLYGPLGPNNVSLRKPLACSPCYTVTNFRDSPCRDNVCMQSIAAAEVLDLARRLLAGESPRAAAATS